MNRTGGALGAAIVCALLLGAASAGAQDAVRPIARGRAFSWGASAIMPVILGDVRERDGRALAYLNPGGGVDGHVGYELPGGIEIGVVGGVAAHASENSRALATYHGAVQGRWTFDLGGDVAPVVGVAIGVLLAQLDAGMVATAYARVLGGVQIVFAPWVALDLAVSLAGALPIDAFADAIAWISPQVGVSFYE